MSSPIESNDTRDYLNLILFLFLLIVLPMGIALFYINSENLFLKEQNKEVMEQLIQQQKSDKSSNQNINNNQKEDDNSPISKTSSGINIFDTSKWAMYDDPEIRLRFNYPEEWGIPLKKIETCDEFCSEDGITKYRYEVRFSNSEFTVGGASVGWAPPRGMNMLFEFQGFAENEDTSTRRYGGWDNREKLCDISWFLECEIETDSAYITSAPSCGGESGSGFAYERTRLINIENHDLIGGLAFGGSFISDEYYPESYCYDTEVKTLTDTALMDRKLHPSSMQTFDAYNAVFETIEIY